MPATWTWHIGKEGTVSTRLDIGPYRAYFARIQDGKIVETSDFSDEELASEISRLSSAGEKTEAHESALVELRKAGR